LPKTKWSDSSSEGKILKRITTAIERKTSAKTLETKSLDDLLQLGRQMAYISVQKSNLAKNSDFEERIKKLENIAMITHDKEDELAQKYK